LIRENIIARIFFCYDRLARTIVTFVIREHPGSDCGYEAAEREHDEDEVGLGRVRLLGLDPPAQLVDDFRGEVVEALANRVEHDEAEGDPDRGVHQREELAAHCLGGRVAIT
jgi:hypothetical protein